MPEIRLGKEYFDIGSKYLNEKKNRIPHSAKLLNFDLLRQLGLINKRFKTRKAAEAAFEKHGLDKRRFEINQTRDVHGLF